MSSNAIKGLTVEIDGDTRGLDAALRSLGKHTSAVNKELGQIERALKFDPSNTVLLGQKQALLADKIDVTKKRLEALRQAQAKVDAMYASGEIDDGQYRAFQRDIVTTENKLETFEGQLKDVERAQEQTGRAAKDMGGDVDKAGDRAKSSSNKLASFKTGLRNVATAAVVAGAAAGAAFVAMTSKILDNADEMQRLSDATGLSAERLGELQYIGNNVGVELDTIARAQAKMTKSMAAGRDGTGEQAEAFKRLGVSIVDSNGELRDSETVMGELFAALDGVANETERDAMAMAIFGRSAQDLNPLITAGADEMNRMAKEARDNGAVMSNEAVAGLDTFGDTLDNIKAGAMGRFGEWFGEVAPEITDFITSLQDSGLDLDDFISPEVMAQLDGLRDVLNELFDNVMPTIKLWYTDIIKPTMDDIGVVFDDLAADVIPTVESIVGSISDNWPMIEAIMGPIVKSVAATIKGIFQVIGGIIKTTMAVIRGDWSGAWEGVENTFGGFVTIFKGQFDRFLAPFDPLEEKLKGVVSGFTDMKDSAIEKVRQLVDKVKSLFDFDLVWPKLKTPHFSVLNWSLNPVDWVENGVPKIDVEWYASGGSFAPGMPSLVGVGDQRSGYEHVLRDDQIVSLMRRALDTTRDSRKIVLQFNQPVQSYSETKRGVRDAMEAMASF